MHDTNHKMYTFTMCHCFVKKIKTNSRILDKLSGVSLRDEYKEEIDCSKHKTNISKCCGYQYHVVCIMFLSMIHSDNKLKSLKVAKLKDDDG